jgi:hypothetical protein
MARSAAPEHGGNAMLHTRFLTSAACCAAMVSLLGLPATGRAEDAAPEVVTVGAASFAPTGGLLLRTATLDAPEGAVDCLEAVPLNSATGAVVGTSFARVCTFAAAPAVDNAGSLSPEALTLDTLVDHVRASLPASTAADPASFPFAGTTVDGVRLTLELAGASADVNAAAVVEGDAIVVVWYQRTAADSASFGALNSFVDGVRLGAPTDLNAR